MRWVHGGHGDHVPPKNTVYKYKVLLNSRKSVVILNEFFEMEIYLKIEKSYLLPMNVKSVLRDLISHRTSLQTPSYC